MKKVFFDTGSLESGHSHRGIGAYTRHLLKELRDVKTIALTSKKEAADLIHYPYFDFFKASLPLQSKKTVVVTIHDVIPLQFPKQYPAGIKGTIALWQQKLALKGVSAVITDSKASKKNIAKHLGVPSKKIQVVSLAASEVTCYQDIKLQQKVSRIYELPARFLLYVGDINYNKNLPMLLEAFSKLVPNNPDLHLVLVGKNFREQAIPEWKALSNSIDTYHLASVVHFVNKVDTERDLAAIYSQAKAYIQPSIEEGFGLPILEAMQCLCPVICFKQSSMEEVAGERAVYPASVSAEALANTLTEVLNWSGTARHRWVLQAYSWAKSFSWKKAALQTVAVYDSV